MNQNTADNIAVMTAGGVTEDEQAKIVADAIRNGERVLEIDGRLFTRALFGKLATLLGGERTEAQLDEDFAAAPGYSAGSVLFDKQGIAAVNTTNSDPTTAPPQIPSINRVVQYCMSEADVDRAKRELKRDGRHGNEPRVGELYPAMIVKVFGDTPGAAFTVQVLLDANFSLWVTSTNITAAPKERHCIWPPRV